ncbi:MAG: hypothetical protein U5L96_11455 [Owenweeksia sp.]|nr:hypothetical protein [Owenweeksia sp.]
MAAALPSRRSGLWLIVRRGRLNFSGSSIAHVGFALIMVGALISNAKKDVISNTNVFLSEDLPSSENALLELKDTVQLGQYLAVRRVCAEENRRAILYGKLLILKQKVRSLHWRHFYK